MGKFLSVVQAAEYVGVSTKTVRRWIASGGVEGSTSGASVDSNSCD